MKRERIHYNGNSKGSAETYRIIDSAGKEITSFTLNDKRPSIVLHLERGGPVLENPMRRLEREAWSFCEALMQTLTEIEKLDQVAALDLYAKMLGDDDSDPEE
jgi:hypothetical protein